MSDLPPVVIGIVTYERIAELTQTLDALLTHVQYPNLHWVISDDCSPTRDKIQHLIQIPRFQHMTFIQTPRRFGWGANANFLLHYCMVHTPALYMFFIEDDYILQQPLDLRCGVAVMETRPQIAMLRYRGTAGTHLFYEQNETDIRPYASDATNARALQYLRLMPDSPTLWLYSNGIHLKRLHGRAVGEEYYPGFHEYYGGYAVGQQLGPTEVKFAHRVKDRMKADENAPQIAILPDWIYMNFKHIGKSFKETEHDISAATEGDNHDG